MVGSKYLPVDIAELVLAAAALERNRDVEGSACRDGAADSGHDNDRDVVEGDICGRFGHKHEALVHAEQVPFVRLDAAFDSGLLVVADKVLGGRDDLLTRQPPEHLRDDLLLWLFVPCL